MANLNLALKAQDSAFFNPPYNDEWSDDQIKDAVDRLEDQILAGAMWDVNCDWRNDFALTVETIFLNKTIDRSERLELIEEAYKKMVHDYCVFVVNGNPDAYCEA